MSKWLIAKTQTGNHLPPPVDSVGILPNGCIAVAFVVVVANGVVFGTDTPNVGVDAWLLWPKRGVADLVVVVVGLLKLKPEFWAPVSVTLAAKANPCPLVAAELVVVLNATASEIKTTAN